MASVTGNMEELIIKGFKNLKYAEFNLAKFKEAITSSEISPYFVQIVCWLTLKLKETSCLKQTLSGEADTFCLELLGLLRDMGCPYAGIIGGNGLKAQKGKMFTLDYLISELQAARICYTNSTINIESMDTDSTAVSGPVLSMMKTLNVPMNSNISSLFQDLQRKINEYLKSYPSNNLPEPLLKKSLSPNQWEKVNQINDAMCQDYKQRRQVLLKRVDVTVQSFCWSDKLKMSEEKVAGAFHPFRSQMRTDSITSVVDVLVARKDLYPVEKTSSGASREATRCELNKIIIPKVPDRGGRPSKTAPPAEMPKFMKRVADPPRGGRGGGRGGSRGGGRGGGGDGRFQGDKTEKGGNQYERSDSGGRGGRGGWRGKQGGGRGRGRGGGGHDDYGSRPSGDTKMYYS